MNKARLKKFATLLFALFWLLFLIKEAFGNGDFAVYLKAAERVANGESPYNEWIFIDVGNYCQYYYSPLWLVLLLPFQKVAYFAPNLIWLLANTYFLYRIFKLLRTYLPVEGLSKKAIGLITLLSLALSARFILYNFQMIQMTPFILWGALESVYLFKKNKPIWGGVILALIINIKIIPLVLLPYLLYRKYYHGFFATLFFYFVFMFLPAIVLGWEYNMSLLSDWWFSINPMKSDNLIEMQKGAHSLSALIPHLLTETEGTLDYRRHVMSFSPKTAILITNFIRAGLISLSLYFLKWPPFVQVKSKRSELRELSYLLLLIPLIFPRQQKYAYAFAIPALYYLNYFLMVYGKEQKLFVSALRYKSILVLCILSFVLMTLSTDGVVGKEFYQITQHYKTITWGALLLVAALVMARPREELE